MKELTHKKNPYVLIITGPTASGKTDLSLKISTFFDVEIINIDVGQFYGPLSIGTAKPDWKNQLVPHHCFDIINEPKDLSVYEFNKIVLHKINEVWTKEKIPVLVGGSLFYIKSLFFQPQELAQVKIEQTDKLKDLSVLQLWEKLNEVDPKRACEIEKNDAYRINRALQIWQTTGIKPSEYRPKFKPPFKSRILFLNPDKKILKERIDTRTKKMIEGGWIKEVENLLGTDWENFLEVKKLIGYAQIIQWLRGEQKNLDVLIKIIQTKTWQYAKRQLTFWRAFKKLLEKSMQQVQKRIKISVINDLSEKTIKKIKLDILADLDALSNF
ncbi:MAG: tRNA (adenosine(37)-N6)-dimethylallyltransferase MiaA [bacterium]